MVGAEVAMRRAVADLINSAVAVTAAAGAFQASARSHLLDTLLDGPRCGNPLQDYPPTLIGHCAGCWAAGGLAGLAALCAMAAMLQAVGLRRTP